MSLDWLNDPWVIGIGGGILSGLVVTAVSRLLLSKRENREYAQKLAAANQEIVYAIRPGIPEGVFPTRQVLAALGAATARKYAVEKGDLFGPSELAQELMKEVMDSSFLSASDKQEHCSKLAEIDKPAQVKSTGKQATSASEARRTASEFAKYRERMTSLMSMMMGMTATATTMLVVFFRERDASLFDEKFQSSIIPIAVAVMSLVLVVFSGLERRVRASVNERPKDRGDRDRKEESRRSPSKLGQIATVVEIPSSTESTESGSARSSGTDRSHNPGDRANG